MAVHLGSLHWTKPPQFSGGSLLGPKPFAVLRWIPVSAEAAAVLRVGPCWGRSLRSSPVDCCLGRSLLQLSGGSLSRPKPRQFSWIVGSTEVSPTLLWIAVRTEVLAVLPDPGLGRSPCRSPFGSPLRPKPWRFTCPESPCRPKPIGIFRPARMSAEAGSLSGRLRVKAEALAVCLPKRRIGRSRSVSPVWAPFRAEALPVLLWRSREAEASGSTGLLDEACRSLQKLGASPLRPHGGGFVSRPRLDVPDLRLRSDPKPFPAAAWPVVPRGDRPGHNWNLSWETESSKPNLPVDNEDNGGRIRPSFAGLLSGSPDPASSLRFFTRAVRP